MEAGPDLAYGSSKLVQTLLRYDLVDEPWLKTFPIIVGAGKRLFSEGAVPMAFKLTGSRISPSGAVTANYARAGEVKPGSFQ